MLSSRFAGIPISSSVIDGRAVPRLPIRGERTPSAVTGSGGRLHFGTVADIKSERRPASNRNRWPDCVGIRSNAVARLAALRRLCGDQRARGRRLLRSRRRSGRRHVSFVDSREPRQEQ